MRALLIVLMLLEMSSLSAAQDSLYRYVAAKSGLTLRESPAANGKVIGKVNYGEKVLIREYVLNIPAFQVDGFRSEWVKVITNGRIGFVADAFLFTAPPPTTGTKTLKEYFDRCSKVSCVVKYGNQDEAAEENYDAKTKTLYKNGAEIFENVGYEWFSNTYVLPQFSIEQAFQLLRLLPQYDMFIKADTPFPQQRMKNATRSIEITNSKDCPTGSVCIEKISFYSEDDGITELKIFQLNGEAYIVFETGV